ncbi:MAG: DUF2752 domain-containing protein [Planctomycetota bacterium]
MTGSLTRQTVGANPRAERLGRETSRLPSSGWDWHVGFGSAVLVLGLLMTTDAKGTVAFAWFPEYPLPMVCLIRKYFAVDCLTCGMTRSIILLLDGCLAESLAHHRMGWFVLLVILLQIPYGIQLRWRGAAAWRPSSLVVEVMSIMLAAVLVGVRFLSW